METMMRREEGSPAGRLAPHRSGRVAVAIAFAVMLPVCGAASAQVPALTGTATGAPQGQSTASSPGVEVKLDGENVFEVRGQFDGRSLEEVAESIEERLRFIAGDPFYSNRLFAINMSGTKALILYRGQVVGVVTAEQAARMNRTAEDAAHFLLQRCLAAIGHYRARRAPAAAYRAAVEMAVATVVLVGLVFGVRRLRRRLLRRYEEDRVAGKGFKLGSLVLDSERVSILRLRWIDRVARVVYILLGLFYAMFAFGVFPMTAGYALSVLDYLIDPLRMLWTETQAHMSDFAFILVALVLTRFLLKFLRYLFDAVGAGTIVVPGVVPEWAPLFYKIVKLGVCAMVVVMIYPYIPGSSSEAFKGLGIVAGALFTLGATGTAGNVFGGLAVTLTGTFRLGDRIKVGDVMGNVVETTLVLTRLRTPKNEIVSLPNSAIMANGVVNYSAKAREEGVILYTEVTIGYDAPWRTVHDLLVAAATETTYIEHEPPPFVLQRSLNDYHVSYQVNAYTRKPTVMEDIYGELHQRIQDHFNAAGVEILSPGFAALRDGNTLTIPESYPARACPPKKFDVRIG
jgi:small-conductance mechanosensitive channel